MLEYNYKKTSGVDKLIVVFCGRDNAQNEKWDWYSLNKRDGVDILWVKDRGDSWYQYEELKTLPAVLDKEYREVYTLGCSMGGYGALLFPTLYEVDAVVAFSPQVILDGSLPLKPIWEDRLAKTDLLWPSVANLEETALLDTSAFVVFGENNEMDTAHARAIKGRTKLLPRPTASHLSWGDKAFCTQLIAEVMGV